MPKVKDLIENKIKAWKLSGSFKLFVMDKIEILEALESAHGTTNPLDVPEPDRWQLYESIKSNIRLNSSNPDDYTRQIILISETLEL